MSPWTLVVCLRDNENVYNTPQIGHLRLNSGNLILSRSAFLEFSHLLPLNGWGGNFLTENDIPNFRRSQRGNIDAISFAKIGEDQVLERNFDLYPLFICQSRPDKMRFRNCRFVGTQDDLGLLVIDMKRTE
jgi:hypothetical protein